MNCLKLRTNKFQTPLLYRQDEIPSYQFNGGNQGSEYQPEPTYQQGSEYGPPPPSKSIPIKGRIKNMFRRAPSNLVGKHACTPYTTI